MTARVGADSQAALHMAGGQPDVMQTPVQTRRWQLAMEQAQMHEWQGKAVQMGGSLSPAVVSLPADRDHPAIPAWHGMPGQSTAYHSAPIQGQGRLNAPYVRANDSTLPATNELVVSGPVPSIIPMLEGGGSCIHVEGNGLTSDLAERSHCHEDPERWTRYNLHVHENESGVKVWLRDAQLPIAAYQATASVLSRQLADDEKRVVKVTINGHAVPTHPVTSGMRDGVFTAHMNDGNTINPR